MTNAVFQEKQKILTTENVTIDKVKVFFGPDESVRMHLYSVYGVSTTQLKSAVTASVYILSLAFIYVYLFFFQ